jgi:hypothetical protein
VFFVILNLVNPDFITFKSIASEKKNIRTQHLAFRVSEKKKSWNWRLLSITIKVETARFYLLGVTEQIIRLVVVSYETVTEFKIFKFKVDLDEG